VASVTGLLVLTLGGEPLEERLASLEPGRISGAAARLAARDALLRVGALSLLGLVLCWAAIGWRPGRLLLLGLLLLDLLVAAQDAVQTTRVRLLDPPPLAAVLKRVAGGPPGAPPRYEARPDRILETRSLAEHPDLSRTEGRDLFLHLHLQTDECYRHGVRAVRAFEAVRDGARAELTGDPRCRELPRSTRLALIDCELLLMTRQEMTRVQALERERLLPLGPTAPDLYLVRNLACPPYAYLVPTGGLAGDRREALDALLGPDCPSAPERVVLGPDWSGPEPDRVALSRPESGSGGQAQVAVEHLSSERVLVSVRSRRAGWLVLRDAFHPDWRATLDGRPVPFLRADLLFRAVHVPPGEHRLLFAYDPWWWTPGVRLMLFAWPLLLAAAALGLRRSRS
jgi:hypothetical protein